jgi:excisionase family DNA binding protein
MDFVRSYMARARVGILIGISVISTSALCQDAAAKRGLNDNDTASLSGEEVRKLVDQKYAPGNSRHYPMVIAFSDEAPVEEEIRDNNSGPELAEIQPMNASTAGKPGPAEAVSTPPQSLSDREVLNLDEAAALLRVDRTVVVQLAEDNALPARQVGNDWRFRRSALLAWLDGIPSARKPEPPPPDAMEAELAAENLRHELQNIRGRGINEPPHAASEPSSKDSRRGEAGNATADPAATAPPASSIGERPTAPTTEDIALRDQRVLLPPGAATMDFGIAYGRSSQTLLPVIRVEQTDFNLIGTMRYGLMNNLQMTLSAPASWRSTKTFVDASVTGTNLSSTFTLPGSIAQDASMSVLGVGWHESVNRPTMIWSLDSTLPFGPGDRGVGGGMVLSKSYDPSVLFAGFTFLYGLRFNPADTNSSISKHNYGVQFGYTYAINDALALSTVFFGTYRDTHSPDGSAIPPPRQNNAVQLGTTWLLGKGFFVEPAVAMQLGGDNPGLTLLLNFSRSFVWRGAAAR